ncbi:MAG: ABC transporter permease [Planctomycetota bacterium]|nr:ABC transporter permease [Planctomycetota bacterium]
MKSRIIKMLIADYGMVFVLLFLCVLISVLTISDIHPEDPRSGRRLAGLMVKKYGKDINVLVVARDIDADRKFAKAIQEELTRLGAHVVGTELGDPYSVRQRLEKSGAESVRVDLVATHNFSSKWKIFSGETLKKLGANHPVLEKLKVVRPPSYRWPTFLTRQNLISILNQNAPIAIMAIGMTLVIITAGIDLSVGSLMALAAVVSAVCVQEFLGAAQASGLSVMLAFFIAMVVCALSGVFAGVMITVFKMPPFVATLGLMMVARGASYILAGGADALKIEATSVGALYSTSILGIPSQIVIMVALFILAHLVMSHTSFGRYVYAVGGNETAARLSGVPVVAVIIAVYAICGLSAGLAGVLDASHFGTGRPKAGEFYELQVIAAVVVGGTSLMGGEGKMFGTFVGALILGVIQNGLNMAGVDSYRQMVIYGGLILVAVLIDQLKKKVIKPAAAV